MRKILLLFLVLVLFQNVNAQNDKWVTKWANDPTNIERLRSQELFNGHHYLIANFPKNPTAAERSWMFENDIELLGYLGNHHYWIRMSSASISNENLQKFNISSLSIPNHQLKSYPVTDKIFEHEKGNALVLKLWNADDLQQLAEDLKARDEIRVDLIDPDRKMLVVSLFNIHPNVFYSHPAIAYVGPYVNTGEALLSNSINMNRVNALQNTSVFGEGLSGAGVNVGIWDGGLTGNHIDINGHMINVEGDHISNSVNDHPTHVAGIVGGKGHKEARTRGMSPGANLFIWDFEGPIISEMEQGISDHNLNIINSSFLLGTYNDPRVETTCQFPGFYVLESAEMDKMVRDHPTLTHVVANGNENSICQGAGFWSGIPIGLQSSKNVINVGWLDVNELFFGGSSVGPTFDGRIKPEVMSKGASVRSTSFDHSYKSIFGSSMAAPATAGSIALLYEWYFNAHGFYPDAALVRAIMCNTAFDLFFDGPDYLFGFGRINALRALETLKGTNYFMDTFSDAQTKTFDIVVGADVSQLNVGIAWTDVEAIPGMIKTLVNDLDMKIIGPGATEYFPWILDPGIPFIAAVTGIDTINNVEQVTIMDPAPGTYTISVTGTDVPFGPQEAAITYDILQRGITVTNPIGGEQWIAGATEYIRWDAFGTGDNFTIDVSYNDGATWQTAGTASTVPLTPATFLRWTIKDTTTHTARIRVSSGIHSGISGPFTIMKRATVQADPCDEHVSTYWNPVRDADDYLVMMLADDEYSIVDTVTDTFYVFSDLINGDEYWVAVQGRDGGKVGPRSNGLLIIPDGSDCNFSDDIGAYDLCHPLGFRYAFDGSLPYNESVQLVIKNYSAAGIAGFNVCYMREGSAMVCEPYIGTLAANAVDTFTFAAVETFTDTLCYEYKLWTAFGSDSNLANDTIEATIKVVPSHPFPIPYYTNFEEAATANYLSKHFALKGIEEWDFFASTSEGRLSVGRLQQHANDGLNAITLDRYNNGSSQLSAAYLNLNLDGYQDSTIYLDFSFAEHLESYEAGDRIWARADNSEPWIEIFEFGFPRSNWRYTDISAINLSRALVIDNAQTFGKYFQLRFGQEGISNAVSMSANDGRSFDNVRVFSAGQDVEVTTVDFQHIYCDSVAGTIPLTVTVRNNSISTVNNVPISFSTSNGTDHTEIIPAISQGDSVTITFTEMISYVPGDVILIDVYTEHAADLYALNDTIKDITIVFQPYAGKDYYDNFESPSSYFPEGSNTTWELGAPANIIIAEAASGSNAWVTNLTGRHNNAEKSYLLTPCFDFSNYGEHPNIAFNLKLEIEENFDNLGFEYSEDGITWKSLRAETQSYNWFNGGGDFWDVNVDEWQTASNNMNLDSLSDPGRVLFRYTLDADDEYKEEGAGIDDIHVTEDAGSILSMTPGQTIINPSLAVSWNFNNWIESTSIVAGIRSTEDIGSTQIGVRKEAGNFDVEGFTSLSRHFWVEEDLPYTLRLYLPYSEYQAFYGSFGDWSAPSRMSVLAYTGLHADSTVANNKNNYRCVDAVQVKPYRNGYILEFDYDGPAEFYIVEQAPCGSTPFVDADGIIANAIDVDDGLVTWSSSAEINIAGYLIEAGIDSLSYDSVGYVLATGDATIAVDYLFTDSLSDKDCYMCYRVWALTSFGDSTCIGEDTASFIFNSLVLIDSFNAVVQVTEQVLVSWGTYEEKCNDRFEVLSSVNGGPYNLIGILPSSGESTVWTPYSVSDSSGGGMDSICYRLDQYFIDGSMQSFGPVCVVFADTTGDTTENVVIGNMTATALNVTDGLVEWNTLAEQGIDGFLIEAGVDSMSYDSIGYLIALGSNSTTAAYTFTDSTTTKECSMCYRVWAISQFGNMIFVGDDTASFIFPSLVMTDSLELEIQMNNDVLVTWGSHQEKCNDYYEVLVSVNGGSYNSLGTVSSSGDHTTWTSYSFTDDVTPKFDTICYQLDQYFIDGSSQSSAAVCVIFPSDTTADTMLEITSIIVTDAICFGSSTGEIDITVIGGQPPYIIRWSNGVETEDIAGLAAGQYIVSVEDAAGEIVTSDIIDVNETPPLTIIGGIVLDVQCIGTSTGSITGIVVAGGSPPYNYSWTNGDNTLDINDLLPGTYQLTVTDDNLCNEISSIFLIDEPTALSVLSILTTDVTCFGEETGAIDLEIGGGNPTYSYLWSDNSITEDISGLSAGTYTCTVTDANNCVLITPQISIEEASPIVITSVAIEDANCFEGSGGAINITVSGGTPQYEYEWSDGSTTQDITDMPAGDYNVEITDAAGCLFASETFTIDEPTELSLATVGITDVNCFEGEDGSIDLEINGGIPEYTYTWSNGSNNEDLIAIATGEYSCTITDQHGCQFTTAVFTVEQPDDLQIASIIEVDNICWSDSAGGIDIEVTGGTTPYDYLWNGDDTTQDLEDLPAGTYSVTITDDHGCSILSDEISIIQPDDILETLVAITHVCDGDSSGSINITFEGGSPPYHIQWSNGDTTEDIHQLPPGMYSYTITDANGCVFVSMTHVVSSSDLEVSNVVIDHVTCKGESDGSISIEVTGGQDPFTYQWNNDLETPSIEGLTAGQYDVVITDGNHCSIHPIYTVTEPVEALEANFETSPESSPGTNDGSITVSVSGGDQPYSFEWNNGATSQDLINLPADEYCVVITDENGCTIERCAIVGTGTAVTDLLKISQLTLYPNPTDDITTLKIKLTEPADLRAHLTDLSGKKITSVQSIHAAEIEFDFRVSDLPAGTYLVSIELGDGFVSMSLVVQH